MTTKRSVSKEEQIGYHKGALNTLVAERSELYRLVKITDSLIQAHASELEKLGVKLPKQEEIVSPHRIKN